MDLGSPQGQRVLEIGSLISDILLNLPFKPALWPRPRRLARPRTSPFHGGNAGSNPAGDAKSVQAFTAVSSLEGICLVALG
jgi:hypothetical protein